MGDSLDPSFTRSLLPYTFCKSAERFLQLWRSSSYNILWAGVPYQVSSLNLRYVWIERKG